MSQARLLFAAAHGSAPPKRLRTLKKLRAELDKLDPSVVAELAPTVLGESTRSGAQTRAVPRVRVRPLRGGDGDPWPRRRARREMKSRHETRVRELNARDVDDDRRAGASERRPVARPRHAPSGGHRPRARRGAGVGILARRSKGTNRALPRGDRAGVWVLHADYLETAPRRGDGYPRRIRTPRRRSRAAMDPGGAPGLDQDRDRGDQDRRQGDAKDKDQTDASARGGDIVVDDESFARRALGPSGWPPASRVARPESSPGRRFASCRCPRNFSSARRRVCSRRRGRECDGDGAWRHDARLVRRRGDDVGPPPRVPGVRGGSGQPGGRGRGRSGGGGFGRRRRARRPAGGEPGSGGGGAHPRDELEGAGRTGEDAAPLTAVIMARGSSRRAVRDAEDRWGAPALDWHWAYHSVIHNRSLPKEEYFLDGLRAETPASPES